jgi:hypothetical protein
MGNHASLSPLLAAFRRHLRAERHDRQARRALQAELSHYNTPAERLELWAIMDRHTPQQTAELRDIVGHQVVPG